MDNGFINPNSWIGNYPIDENGSHGADITCAGPDAFGNTPLANQILGCIEALKARDLLSASTIFEEIMPLIDAKADINAQNPQTGKTILMMVVDLLDEVTLRMVSSGGECYQKLYSYVRLLFQRLLTRVDLTAKNRSGSTILMMQLEDLKRCWNDASVEFLTQKIEVISQLLSLETDVNVLSPNTGETIFMQVVAFREEVIRKSKLYTLSLPLQMLFQQLIGKVNLEARNVLGDTVLNTQIDDLSRIVRSEEEGLQAVALYKLEIIQTLISRGANCQALHPYTRRSLSLELQGLYDTVIQSQSNEINGTVKKVLEFLLQEISSSLMHSYWGTIPLEDSLLNQPVSLSVEDSSTVEEWPLSDSATEPNSNLDQFRSPKTPFFSGFYPPATSSSVPNPWSLKNRQTF